MNTELKLLEITGTYAHNETSIQWLHEMLDIAWKSSREFYEFNRRSSTERKQTVHHPSQKPE